MSIRVFLVDDHPVVVSGLSGALAAQADLAVVGHAGSIAEARHLLPNVTPDVVLVDMRLPDGLGLELIDASAGARPGPAWLMLSSFESPQYLAAALQAGAAGYLLKTAPLTEIVEAIRRASLGMISYRAADLRQARSGAEAHLTKRESEVLTLVIAGRSNDEIGAQLRISSRTVETHLAQLYRRFGVSTRTELAVRAEREGWLELFSSRGIPSG